MILRVQTRYQIAKAISNSTKVNADEDNDDILTQTEFRMISIDRKAWDSAVVLMEIKGLMPQRDSSV